MLRTSLLILLACTAHSCAQSRQALPGSVVQPGPPGAPSKALPPATRASEAPVDAADIEFMQGMIMHHQQAVEMSGLISDRTRNKAMLDLGRRINLSQSDEIRFMHNWLAARGEPAAMPKPMPMHAHGEDDSMPLMPGMLTRAQMDELRKAGGAQFDRLFLSGMIQHHRGALAMVKQLFDSGGSGQDPELFDFATDVDNTQRAEINLMEKMLKDYR
ncbi:MAG: DUF305 domain-containing protein [Acidobacteria bacterium]|nr:DUF305 domain-containing protein [Acidobacteriota bacterium]